MEVLFKILTKYYVFWCRWICLYAVISFKIKKIWNSTLSVCKSTTWILCRKNWCFHRNYHHLLKFLRRTEEREWEGAYLLEGTIGARKSRLLNSGGIYIVVLVPAIFNCHSQRCSVWRCTPRPASVKLLLWRLFIKILPNQKLNHNYFCSSVMKSYNVWGTLIVDGLTSCQCDDYIMLGTYIHTYIHST